MNIAIELLFLGLGIAIGAVVMFFARRAPEIVDQTPAIEAAVEPLAQRLGEFDKMMREIENKRHEDSGHLRGHIEALLKRADKIETAAMALSNQTSTLVTALKSPATRGKWGEITLRNVVEKAGMLPYCDFNEQQTIAPAART